MDISLLTQLVIHYRLACYVYVVWKDQKASSTLAPCRPMMGMHKDTMSSKFDSADIAAIIATNERQRAKTYATVKVEGA